MTSAGLSRGEVVAIAGRGGDFTGKPRPAVIVQSDLFAALQTVTVCPLTSSETDASALRLRIDPSDSLSLRAVSWIAVEKITTVRRERIGPSIGHLPPDDLQRLNGAIALFLGIAG